MYENEVGHLERVFFNLDNIFYAELLVALSQPTRNVPIIDKGRITNSLFIYSKHFALELVQIHSQECP